MKKSLLKLLCCPQCKKEELALKIFQQKTNRVVQGLLHCPSCEEVFPIIDEVPILISYDKLPKLTLKQKEIIKEFIKKYTFSDDKLTDYLKFISPSSSSVNISKEEINEVKFWEKHYCEENLANLDRMKEKKGGDRLYSRDKYIFSFLRRSISKHGLVLEIGCGIPTTAKALLNISNNEYIGTDLSFNILQSAKKLIPLGNFFQCDAEALPFNKNSFDAIISLGVLHHTSRLEENIPSLFEVLKPGGYLAIHEPLEGKQNNYAWLSSLIKRFVSPKGIPPMEDKLEKTNTLNVIEKRGTIILCKEEYSPVRWILVKVFRKLMAKNLYLTKLIVLIDDMTISSSRLPGFKCLNGAGAIIVSQKFK